MKTQADLERMFRSHFLPPPKQIWWEWARNGGIVLAPPIPTPMPGIYDVTRTPHLLGMADAFEDPDTREVICKKGSRTGASILTWAWLASCTKFNPGPTLIATANMDVARRQSRTALKPLFENAPELKELIRRGRENWKDDEYNFTTCSWWIIGGNSASQAASISAMRVHVDEENKFQDDTEEGDAVKLILERSKGYQYTRKNIRTCTPTLANGRISLAYEETDKRVFLVPCPHCGHRQELAWARVQDVEGVSWGDLDPQDAATRARIVCSGCAGKWDDTQRIDAIHAASKLPNRGWESTGRSMMRGLVGFHMPSLISTMISMEGIVSEFLRSRDTPSQNKNFINSWLGEDWKPETVRAKSTTLDNCKAAYTWGTSPENDPHIKAMTAGLEFRIFTHGDVQKNGIWAWTQIYWQTGHSALIGFQFINGYSELEEFSKKEWDIQGKKWKSHFVSIDCGDGNRTREIYDQCMAYNWIGAKGANRDLPMLFEYKEWNMETGRAGGTGALVPGLYIDTGAIKHNLIAVMDGTQPIPPEDFTAGIRPKGPQFWIPSDIPDTVPRQLTSEEYDIGAGEWKVKKGRAGSDGNHLFDCAVNVYGMAVFNQLCFREIQ